MPEPISPAFMQAYSSYVCPVRKPILTPYMGCAQALRAPPLKIQEQIVQVVDQADPLVRPILMASLLDDRIEDAKYIVLHEREFVEFDAIFRRSEKVDDDLTPFDSSRA